MPNLGKYTIDSSGWDRSFKHLKTDETIPPDEPVFLFRAKDALMLPVLLHYIHLCTEQGTTPEHVAGIYEQLARVARWQQENSAKIPD